MEEQLATFLDYLQTTRNYSDNTTAAYRNDLNQFYKFLHNHPTTTYETWQEIDEATVTEYVQGITAKKYASSTIARKVAAIKSFFGFLNAHGHITADPSTDVDSPKIKKRLPKTLSTEEVESLLAAPKDGDSPKNLRDIALLQLLYATGLRVTELVSITVADIDLPKKHLYCDPETSNERILPLDNQTVQVLTTYLHNGRPHLTKKPDATPLFLNHRGQQLTRQGLWLIIKNYAKRANIKSKVTPHTLRHSFAAHKLNNGSELEDIQKLLGHANISTTQIYAQLAEETNEDA
ncbi:MAG TPA: site-specific tyrosine recombinase/integron integrase [Anaerolineae bacterium]|nr:site-specific tyrosine recombinase/integron integrase [Anaerolineae bacterium]